MTPEQRQVLFSSNSFEWGTPTWLFSFIQNNDPFTLDVCASEKNAKVKPAYYTKEIDCFTQPWLGRWWCNPVYGEPEEPCGVLCKKKRCVAPRGKNKDQPPRGHVYQYQPGCIDFVRYGIGQVEQYGGSGTYLIPARVDTEWFGLLFRHASTVLFIKGRIPFLNERGEEEDPAPFPSAVIEIVQHPPLRPLVDIITVPR